MHICVCVCVCPFSDSEYIYIYLLSQILKRKESEYTYIHVNIYPFSDSEKNLHIYIYIYLFKYIHMYYICIYTHIVFQILFRDVNHFALHLKATQHRTSTLLQRLKSMALLVSSLQRGGNPHPWLASFFFP